MSRDTQELIEALRHKPSRDNRALLDEAADRLSELEKIAEFYRREAGKLAGKFSKEGGK